MMEISSTALPLFNTYNELCVEYNQVLVEAQNAEEAFEEEEVLIIDQISQVEAQIILESRKGRRRFWCKPANSGFWEDVVPKMTADMFRDHFRVDRLTFDKILEVVREDMTTIDTQLRKCIPVAKKLCIALKTLATNSEYREIAAQMASKFEQRWQYPMAVGAFDGTHVRITVPKPLKTDYFNYKEDYSILTLAICDANYVFYFVKTGLPGRSNDSGAFRSTPLFDMFEENLLFPESTRYLENVLIPYHILGDSAFSLKPWLTKPFTFRTEIPADERVFNRRHSRARRVIENAFGRLKGRWRRIMKDPFEVKLEDAGSVVMVACALHNICERNRVSYDNNWSQPEARQVTMSGGRREGIASEEGKQVRNALKTYFFSQPYQPTSENI